MEGGLIKLIVVAVFLFLSYVSKQLEKKAQQQRRGGGPPQRRRTGLEALAELEKKLREAQRSAEAQARARQGGGGAAPSAPTAPTAARPRTPPDAAGPPATAPERSVDEPPRLSAGAAADAVAARHIETHVGGLESRHLADAMESRHLDLDVVKAREGHAVLLDSRTETDALAAPGAQSRPTSGTRLPRRLSELQRALVWSEILGPPASMRENSRG